MVNEFPPKPKGSDNDPDIEASIQDAEQQRNFAAPERRARPADPWPVTGPTEFSWGAGLTPPGQRRAAPGFYRGTTPRRNRMRARDYDAPGNSGIRVR